jgi:hypothetical protein
MFGYGIKIFKKNKGVKVDPVKPKPKEDPEYVKWKKEKERKERDENHKHNKALVWDAINEKAEHYIKEYMLQVPQPFEVGEMITYNYYGNNNPFTIGYHDSPGRCAKMFGAPDLDGPFQLPVHKIFVNDDKLKYGIAEYLNIPRDRKINSFRANDIATRAWHTMLNRTLNSRHRYMVEWVVDFDWEGLKIPCENSSNEEGWLNLRWGGFNAGWFIPSSRPFSKRQRKLWKKEKKYRDMKEKMEAELKSLTDEFESCKKSLM